MRCEQRCPCSSIPPLLVWRSLTTATQPQKHHLLDQPGLARALPLSPCDFISQAHSSGRSHQVCRLHLLPPSLPQLMSFLPLRMAAASPWVSQSWSHLLILPKERTLARAIASPLTFSWEGRDHCKCIQCDGRWQGRKMQRLETRNSVAKLAKLIQMIPRLSPLPCCI